MEQLQVSKHFTVNVLHDGQNSVTMDLDNENDSFVYDGAGNRRSSVITSQAKVYDGETLVSAADVVWSISAVSGVTLLNGGAATNNSYDASQYPTHVWIKTNGLVTVNGMSGSSGYVKVCADYNGTRLYKTLNLKKIVNSDKYEIVTVPTAIPYNETDDSPSSNTVTIRIYRTDVTGTRSPVTNLSTYGLELSVTDESGNSITISHTNGNQTYTFSTDNSESGRYYISLTKSGSVIDAETVPVVKAKNGKNAVRIDIDNEADMVSCDSEGQVRFERTVTVKAKIYNGASVATSGVTLPDVASSIISSLAIGGISPVLYDGTIGDNYKITGNNNTVSSGILIVRWSFSKGDSLTNGTYPKDIQLKFSNTTYTSLFTLTTSTASAIYQLQPSKSEIPFSMNGKNVYNPATDTISCTYIKITGSTTVKGTTAGNFDGHNIFYRRLNAAGVPVNENGVEITTGSTWSQGWTTGHAPLSITVNPNSSVDAIEFCISTVSNNTNVADSNIVDREKVPVVRGEETVNPNILLRTIFDKYNNNTKDLAFIKEKWDTTNDSTVFIDNSSTTITHGKKCIRLSGRNYTNNVNFKQNVISRVKAGTWYTLSFYSYSTNTTSNGKYKIFIYNANGSGDGRRAIDKTAGMYVDGKYIDPDHVYNDGMVEFYVAWDGKRHTITFKTSPYFTGTYNGIEYNVDNFNILFRCPYDSNTTVYKDVQLALCMPKLEEGQKATAYVANDDDLKGEKGNTGNQGPAGKDSASLKLSFDSFLYHANYNGKAIGQQYNTLQVYLCVGGNEYALSSPATEGGDGATFIGSLNGLTISYYVEQGGFWPLTISNGTSPSGTIKVKGVKTVGNVSYTAYANIQVQPLKRPASVRGPRVWTAGVAYKSGGSGEEFLDIVIHKGVYYQCISSHTSSSSDAPDVSDNGKWQQATSFDFVATGLLLSKRAKVENLFVDDIEARGNNKYTRIDKGLFEIGAYTGNESDGYVDNVSYRVSIKQRLVNGSLKNYAVLEFLEDGEVVGQIDSSLFTNRTNIADTWQNGRFQLIGNGSSRPTYPAFDTARNYNGTVYYKYSEGYTKNGDVITYNDSGTASHSVKNGSWFKSMDKSNSNIMPAGSSTTSWTAWYVECEVKSKRVEGVDGVIYRQYYMDVYKAERKTSGSGTSQKIYTVLTKQSQSITGPLEPTGIMPVTPQ